MIDDAHWLDLSSALALAFVAHRLDGLAVAMLVATRSERGTRWPDENTRAVELSGLSPEAVIELLDGRAAPSVARELADVAHGNPLALFAIYDALTDNQRWGRVTIRDLPEGRGPGRQFHGRLAGLDPDARLAVSVVAHDDRLDRSVVVAVCTSLGARDAEAGVSAAEHLGLLRADPPRLALVHPLLRSEVDLFEPAERVRAVHRAIAETLRRDADLERRAWHLSRSVEGPDAVCGRPARRGREPRAHPRRSERRRYQLPAGGRAERVRRRQGRAPRRGRRRARAFRPVRAGEGRVRPRARVGVRSGHPRRAAPPAVDPDRAR